MEGNRGPRYKAGRLIQDLSVAGKYEAERRMLSAFAARSEATRGRRKTISPDRTRTEYERDYHRILFSLAFSRLRHKTQVFCIPANDHICTRMEHALHVASISATVCWHLGLNVDLANAIALGHDLGHAPFGHSGEQVLNEVCRTRGLSGFMHEAHSLRVVDVMKELNGAELNLTYEVRDGIVCHLGEDYSRTLVPERERDVTLVGTDMARRCKPSTLEGCVVRYVDRVAYLARDLQDALELGILQKKDMPKEVKRYLGTDAGEIIGRLTSDIILESKGHDSVAVSEEAFGCMREFYQFSVDRIYNCDVLQRQRERAKKIIADLFDQFLDVFQGTVRGREAKLRAKYQEPTYRNLFEFVARMNYSEEEPPQQIILDFMAGMTDIFALRSYNEIFLATPLV